MPFVAWTEPSTRGRIPGDFITVAKKRISFSANISRRFEREGVEQVIVYFDEEARGIKISGVSRAMKDHLKIKHSSVAKRASWLNCSIHNKMPLGRYYFTEARDGLIFHQKKGERHG
jgi:hypothetical protein